MQAGLEEEGVNALQYHRQGRGIHSNRTADNAHVCISMFARQGVYTGCVENCFSEIVDLGIRAQKV